MHNKILALLISLAVAISCSITAFATTSEEPSESTSEELLNCSEEEYFSEGTPTVNISDESITAIADAVVDSSTITTSDGITVTVPDFVLNEWNNYRYRTCYLVNGVWCWILSNEIEVTGSGTDTKIEHFDGVYTYSASYDYFSDLPNYGWGQSLKYYRWTNYYIIGEDGEIVRLPDVTPEPEIFTISFDTGFSDLTEADQESDSLKLPNLKKDGYAFLGWYLDRDYETAFSADYILTSDITLYAKWAEEPPMVFFHNAVFESLSAFISAEPVFYLFALMCLLVVVGVFRLIITTR